MVETFNCENTKLSQGSKGSQVTLLQTHLKSLGYYVTYNGHRLVVDGSYGTYTAWAVKQFQKANGLTQDGYFGPQTCKVLNNKINKTTVVTNATTFDCPNINLKMGSSGELVKKLQTLLKQLGYYSKEVDGSFGTYTDSAVKAFQRATQHSDDGVFGPKTCKSMNELINKSNTSKETTAKTTTTTKTTAAVVKKDPYLVDKTKNQFKDVDANLNVDGLNFIISGVTFTTPQKVGTWKRIDLMNGGQYVYKTNPVPREYSVDLIMSKKQYTNLKNEFYKMMHRVCNVTSTIIDSGKYTVELSLAYQNVNSRKVTLKLTEYLG